MFLFLLCKKIKTIKIINFKKCFVIFLLEFKTHIWNELDKNGGGFNIKK